jgi:hypothetical protein
LFRTPATFMMYCVKIMKQMFESMLGIKAQVDEINNSKN